MSKRPAGVEAADLGASRSKRLFPNEEDEDRFMDRVNARKRFREGSDVEREQKRDRFGTRDMWSALPAAGEKRVSRGPPHRVETKRVRDESGENMRALVYAAHLILTGKLRDPSAVAKNREALARFYASLRLLDRDEVSPEMQRRIEAVLMVTGRLETDETNVHLDEVGAFMDDLEKRETARLRRYLDAVRVNLGWDDGDIGRACAEGGTPGSVEDVIWAQTRLLAICFRLDPLSQLTPNQES